MEKDGAVKVPWRIIANGAAFNIVDAEGDVKMICLGMRGQPEGEHEQNCKALLDAFNLRRSN